MIQLLGVGEYLLGTYIHRRTHTTSRVLKLSRVNLFTHTIMWDEFRGLKYNFFAAFIILLLCFSFLTRQ